MPTLEYRPNNPDSYDAIVGQAFAFKHASEKLCPLGEKYVRAEYAVLNNKGDGPDLILKIPAIVTAAFSCELFLKALLTRKGTNFSKVHKLSELFDSLDKNSKKEIENKTSELNKAAECIGWSSFEDELKNISDFFVTWRYPYETSHLECKDEKLMDLFERESKKTSYSFSDEFFEEYRKPKLSCEDLFLEEFMETLSEICPPPENLPTMSSTY